MIFTTAVDVLNVRARMNHRRKRANQRLARREHDQGRAPVRSQREALVICAMPSEAASSALVRGSPFHPRAFITSARPPFAPNPTSAKLALSITPPKSRPPSMRELPTPFSPVSSPDW